MPHTVRLVCVSCRVVKDRLDSMAGQDHQAERYCKMCDEHHTPDISMACVVSRLVVHVNGF